MPVMKPNCFVNVEGAQCSLKVAYKTGECWLQTALAHNQFMLRYLSFVSFIHPVVLHTKFMTRYHQPLSDAVPDDVLKNKVTLNVTFTYRLSVIEFLLVLTFN